MRFQKNKMKFYICVVLLVASCAYEAFANELAGSYYVHVRKLELCKHSMEQDPNHIKVDTNLSAVKVTDTEDEIKGSITYYNDFQLDKMTISAKTIDPNDPEPLNFVKDIKKPCENVFLFMLMKKIYNIDSNCNVKKGTYKVEGVNPGKMIHLLFKGLHYGTFTSIVEWSTKNGGVVCIQTEADVKKP